MARFLIFGLIHVLCMLFHLIPEGVCDDGVHGSNESEWNVNHPEEDHVAMAQKWLLGERQADFSYGDHTSRVLVALALSDAQFSSQQERDLVNKRLHIKITLDLLNDRSPSSVSKLALDVNALLATCENPRNFQGMDLAQILREWTDNAHSLKMKLPSSVYLTLCLLDQTKDEDFQRVYHDVHADGIADRQALGLIALSCMVSEEKYKLYQEQYLIFLEKFMKLHANSIKSKDAYTSSVVMQALIASHRHQPPNAQVSFAERMSLGTQSIIAAQKEDGSFGNVLTTYFALPVLKGRTLLDLKDNNCNKKVDGDTMDVPQLHTSVSNVLKVRYSLWMGKNNDLEMHTMDIAAGRNWTFFDVMRIAQTKSYLYSFDYEVTDAGVFVYSVSGTPNDSEKQHSWILYKNPPKGTERTKRMVPLAALTTGVDRINLKNNDHFVFWFKNFN